MPEQERKETIIPFSDREQVFYDAVLSNDGRITAIIHPNFENDPMFHRYWDPDKTSLATFKRQLSQLLESSMPLVIFEESHRITDTIKLMESKDNTLYSVIIPTWPGDPNPKLLEGLAEKRTSDWEIAIEFLKRFGVKHISVCGRNYIYDARNKVNGCVHIASEILKEDFNVKFVPKLCYPHQPLSISTT